MMLSISQFSAMRAPVRALVYLFWIYTFVVAVVGVFTQIYIYQLFGSVSFNIIATMVGFTGGMLSFCGYGAIAAHFKWNARHGFLLSFICTSIGILLLSGAQGIESAYAAMAMIGGGNGFFWLTIHTYELVETHDDERDVYSTYLSAGAQLISLAGPAFATLLILVSHLLGWREFSLLFIATPAIFLLGFLYFDKLSDYHPLPIRGYDVAHFVSDRRNRIAQIYLLGGAATHILRDVLIPLVSITILGTALNVGSFNTLFAIVGMVALLTVGAYRHQGNRLLILGITAGVLVVLSIVLGYALSVAALVVYMLGSSIVNPLMRVSEHVIDLQTMGSVGHEESDFYPTMIFRDLSLWAWRMLAGGVLLIAVSFVYVDTHALTLGMYLIAGSFILMYFGAYLLVAKQ